MEGLHFIAYILKIFSQGGIGSYILRASVMESGERKMVKAPFFIDNIKVKTPTWRQSKESWVCFSVACI